MLVYEKRTNESMLVNELYDLKLELDPFVIYLALKFKLARVFLIELVCERFPCIDFGKPLL